MPIHEPEPVRSPVDLAALSEREASFDHPFYDPDRDSDRGLGTIRLTPIR